MHAPLFLALVLAVPAGAAAQSPGASSPTRAQVRQLLSGVEDVPSDEDWRRIGDGALPHLIALYADADQPPYVRLRAVGATGAFLRPAVRTFLMAVARAEGQSDLIAREAVRALARAFGQEAAGALRGFLDHAEPVVRDAAVTSLARIGGETATAALRARLGVERDPGVRRTLERALR